MLPKVLIKPYREGKTASLILSCTKEQQMEGPLGPVDQLLLEKKHAEQDIVMLTFVTGTLLGLAITAAFLKVLWHLGAPLVSRAILRLRFDEAKQLDAVLADLHALGWRRGHDMPKEYAKRIDNIIKNMSRSRRRKFAKAYTDLARKILSAAPRTMTAAVKKTLHIAPYVLTKETLNNITDPLELYNNALPGLRATFPDKMRKKYWKNFPYELLKARRLRKPKKIRKHKLGGLMLNRSDMFELYSSLRATIAEMKSFIKNKDLGTLPPARWKVMFLKSKLSPIERRSLQIAQVKQDLKLFETFFLKIRTLWGKRGIETYLVYWD